MKIRGKTFCFSNSVSEEKTDSLIQWIRIHGGIVVKHTVASADYIIFEYDTLFSPDDPCFTVQGGLISTDELIDECELEFAFDTEHYFLLMREDEHLKENFPQNEEIFRQFFEQNEHKLNELLKKGKPFSLERYERILLCLLLSGNKADRENRKQAGIEEITEHLEGFSIPVKKKLDQEDVTYLQSVYLNDEDTVDLLRDLAALGENGKAPGLENAVYDWSDEDLALIEETYTLLFEKEAE